MNEFLKRISDYFDPDQLVDLLGITTDEIVDYFQNKIEEHSDLLKDYMSHGR